MNAAQPKGWSREELDRARARVRSVLGSESSYAERRPPQTVAIPADAPPSIGQGPAFRAAAVLSRFRLDELREFVTDPAELSRLKERSLLLREQAGGGWRTLPPDVRNSILRTLSVNELAGLVAQHARHEDPLQSTLRAVLAAGPQDTLGAMSTGELGALLQVYDGLSSATKLPPRELIERKLQLARLLEPLRLTTTSFSGREAELQKLRNYVGVLSTGSWITDGIRALGDALFTPTPKPPFLIFGAGGVGKTSLTARFILEHALAAEKQRFPFAYVDFDRPTVLAESAPTLLVEAIGQIGLQYETAFAASERLRERWLKRLASKGSPDPSFDQSYVKDFAGFLETLEAREGPVLLVLDTFEEVQRTSDAYAASVVQLVNALTADVPRLRVVIAGRSPIAGVNLPDEHTIELAEFDEGSALAYLIGRQVDPETAQIVVTRTNGNPLTLTLAIELYRREPQELRKLDPARLADGIIQSFLFDRILFHITDPEVQRLAHPGLVLRRVTPEIILEVLAVPCGISVTDLKRAEELFAKLALDSTLVTKVDARVLVHRSDVRRLMLQPLRQHEPDKVRDIHSRAVVFYSRSSDLISRAEGAYHRLSLCEEREDLGHLLTDDLEPMLRSAIEEFPLAAQAMLAARYSNIAISPMAAQAADQETWERITCRRVTELLQTGNPAAAESIFAERSTRSPQTEILFVEAMWHDALGDPSGARQLATKGIDEYRAAGNSRALVRMLLLAADLDRRAGLLDSSYSLLSDAEEIARRRSDPLMLVSVLSSRWNLCWIEESSVEQHLEREMAKATADVADEIWVRERPLLRTVVGQIAHQDPAIVSRAMRLGALELRAADLEYLVRLVGDDALRKLAETPTEESIEALVTVLRREAQEVTRAAQVPNAPSRNIRLKPAHRECLRDLFVNHYGSTLGSFVEMRYSRGLESVSFGGDDAPRTAMDLVRAAEREGWLNDLIVGMARSRFASPDVLQFLDAIGLGPAVRVASSRAAVPEKRLRTLFAEYRISIAALETRTCAIFEGETQSGNGFLVDGGVVVTAPAAMRDSASFVFDRVALEGKTIDVGMSLFASRRQGEELNQATLRVRMNESIDRYPVESSRAAPDAPIRGAVELPTSPIRDLSAPIFWLWRSAEGTSISGVEVATRHPSGRSCVVEAVSAAGVTGAPCFDAALNVIGVHGGPHDSNPKASLIQLIADATATLGVTQTSP